MLDTRFVRECSSELIAAAIVHEATHARLWRCGLSYEAALRPRMERLCISQELVFASKLPDGKAVAEWATLGLTNPPDLRDEAFDARRQTGSVELLRYRKVPEWLIRIVEKILSARRG
jgi:hypothetical protein